MGERRADSFLFCVGEDTPVERGCKRKAHEVDFAVGRGKRKIKKVQKKKPLSSSQDREAAILLRFVFLSGVFYSRYVGCPEIEEKAEFHKVPRSLRSHNSGKSRGHRSQVFTKSHPAYSDHRIS